VLWRTVTVSVGSGVGVVDVGSYPGVVGEADVGMGEVDDGSGDEEAPEEWVQ
jgi:hypothetical protein